MKHPCNKQHLTYVRSSHYKLLELSCFDRYSCNGQNRWSEGTIFTQAHLTECLLRSVNLYLYFHHIAKLNSPLWSRAATTGSDTSPHRTTPGCGYSCRR